MQGSPLAQGRARCEPTRDLCPRPQWGRAFRSSGQILTPQTPCGSREVGPGLCPSAAPLAPPYQASALFPPPPNPPGLGGESEVRERRGVQIAHMGIPQQPGGRRGAAWAQGCPQATRQAGPWTRREGEMLGCGNGGREGWGAGDGCLEVQLQPAAHPRSTALPPAEFPPLHPAPPLPSGGPARTLNSHGPPPSLR